MLSPPSPRGLLHGFLPFLPYPHPISMSYSSLVYKAATITSVRDPKRKSLIQSSKSNYSVGTVDLRPQEDPIYYGMCVYEKARETCPEYLDQLWIMGLSKVSANTVNPLKVLQLSILRRYRLDIMNTVDNGYPEAFDWIQAHRHKKYHTVAVDGIKDCVVQALWDYH